MALEQLGDRAPVSNASYNSNLQCAELLSQALPAKRISDSTTTDPWESVFGNFRVTDTIPVSDQPAIKWSNSLYDSFQQAVAQNKPLVVEFSQPTCEWCNKLNTETMNDPSVQQFGDKAVFTRLDPNSNDDASHNVSKLAQELGVDRYPTTVVLDVSNQMIKERGRIVGYYPANMYSQQLAQLIPNQTMTASLASPAATTA